MDPPIYPGRANKTVRRGWHGREAGPPVRPRVVDLILIRQAARIVVVALAADSFASERTAVLEIYDPSTNEWTTGRPLLSPRGGVASVVACVYLRSSAVPVTFLAQ